jgi:release factor glutamine methyltransferase
MKEASGGTIGQVLSHARKTLSEYNIESPALESELLLRYTLGFDRVQLYIEHDSRISPEREEYFWRLIERRLNREPAAYISGHREFFGLDFYVNSNVLIPRPETELLVEEALNIAERHPITTIADIGTGSGAIAVSLATKLPRSKIYATDISAAALEVAALNCNTHQVSDRVLLLQGDLLEPLPEPVDLIAANLPYVRESDLKEVNTVGFEPVLALDGGPDGLDKIRRLCSQMNGKLNPGGSLLLEIGIGQAEPLITILKNLYPSAQIQVIPDLTGKERVLKLNIP